MLVQNKYHITRVMFQKTQDRVESRMLLSTLEVDLGGGGEQEHVTCLFSMDI